MLREQDFHKASKCYPTDYVLITKGEMLPLGWRDLLSPFTPQRCQWPGSMALCAPPDVKKCTSAM